MNSGLQGRYKQLSHQFDPVVNGCHIDKCGLSGNPLEEHQKKVFQNEKSTGVRRSISWGAHSRGHLGSWTKWTLGSCNKAEIG